MGLDMFALGTKEVFDKLVDFSTMEGPEIEVFYWRKHPDMHGWMKKLYEEKGGQSEHGFNGDGVVLALEDLDRLEKDVKGGQLPHTTGFFFGSSDWYTHEDDLEFIQKARQAITDGYTVYYTSSW
jgi:hypothetical protein